jgi:hypothetical protein
MSLWPRQQWAPLDRYRIILAIDLTSTFDVLVAKHLFAHSTVFACMTDIPRWLKTHPLANSVICYPVTDLNDDTGTFVTSTFDAQL